VFNLIRPIKANLHVYRAGEAKRHIKHATMLASFPLRRVRCSPGPSAFLRERWPLKKQIARALFHQCAGTKAEAVADA